MPSTPTRKVALIPLDATDSTITRFDEPHFVAFHSSTSRGEAPLVLFMAGTGGKPREMAFFAQLLRAGRRIISISYNTKEAIPQVCPRHPDAECAAKVRRKRIYGENTIDVIDNAPNEAIVPRFIKRLASLDRTYHTKHWRRYLNHGAIDWSRVVVTALAGCRHCCVDCESAHGTAYSTVFKSLG